MEKYQVKEIQPYTNNLLTMKRTNVFSKWTQLASFFLIGGALAWAAKLMVIISTDGRIIDTGAAAILMSTGLVLLTVGSTGIGNYLSVKRAPIIRILAILFSPIIVFASFILFAFVTSPLFQYSSVWYAQQEAPIGLAVLVYSAVGYWLNRSYIHMYK